MKNPTPRGDVPPRPSQRKTVEPSAAEQRELVQYFEQRAARLPVRETTETPSGQILDWIDIRSQQPRGDIATPPPAPKISEASLDGRTTQGARFELQESGRR